jgi:hypothetical protein
MSSVQCSIFRRTRTSGGVISYPSKQLYEEVAFIAYHFHWQRDDILDLDHANRQLWVAEINKINENL